MKKFFSTALTVTVLMNLTSAAEALEAPGKGLASREQFNKMVYEALKDNPEVVEQALLSLQKKRASVKRKQQAGAVKKNWQRIYDAVNYPVLGNPNAPHTVVAFLDHRCGFCQHMLKDILQYVAEHPDVRIILRDYPFLSEVSSQLAELSLLAHLKGKANEFAQATLELEGQVDATHVAALADKLGLPKKLSDDEHDQIERALKETKLLAEELNIHSTPTFIVAQYVYEDYRNLESFDRLITRRLRNPQPDKKQAAPLAPQPGSLAPQEEKQTHASNVHVATPHS